MIDTDRSIEAWWDEGTPENPDRVEVVRYDRASKWYIEHVNRPGRGGKPQRQQAPIRKAALLAAHALWVDRHPGSWRSDRQTFSVFHKTMQAEKARIQGH